jgi:hypothetical protein
VGTHTTLHGVVAGKMVGQRWVGEWREPRGQKRCTGEKCQMGWWVLISFLANIKLSNYRHQFILWSVVVNFGYLGWAVEIESESQFLEKF